MKPWEATKRYASRAKKAGTATALATAVIAIVAVVCAVLGTTGTLTIGTDLFRNLVLYAAAALLVGVLVADDERRRSLEDQRTLSNQLADRHADALTEIGTANANIDQAIAAVGSAFGAVREVQPHEVTTGFEELLERSTEWLFRGGSGRFLRTDTLPALARNTHVDVPVSVQLLDPRDRVLCDAYARYRALARHERNVREDEGDAARIQADLLAAIYAAGWWTANSRIDATVSLARTFSPLRVDLGSTAVFVTIADKEQPSLLAERDTWLYNSLRDELSQASKTLELVRMPPPHVFPQERHLVNGDAVAAALAEVQVVDGLVGDPAPLLIDFADAAELDFEDIARRVFVDPDE